VSREGRKWTRAEGEPGGEEANSWDHVTLKRAALVRRERTVLLLLVPWCRR
jgi:hypothetical protein